MSKVVVLGLDGFNPELVQRWLDELPNFKKMQEEGIWGEMQSTVPPITPQAWTCAQVGRNPGAFGFWDFTYRDDFSYGQPKLVNSKIIKPDPLYRLLSKMGKKLAVINVPVTYPPPNIEGAYFITSFMTPSTDHDFTYPKELKKEINELVGEYILDASLPGQNYRTMDKDVVMKRIYDMDSQRFTLLKHFITEKDCDYIFTVIMGTDRMPHLFYRYFDEKHKRYDPDSRYQDTLKEHYKFVDKNVGEIRSLLDDYTVLFIHSDHSVQRLDGRINLNEWLINEGYMTLKEYPSELNPFNDLKVDWANTKAWATGYTGQIYLNVKGRESQGIVDPDDYYKLLNELTVKMLEIPDDEGKPLNTQVFRKEDIHFGPYTEYGPDLFIHFDECRWNISEMVGYKKLYSYDTPLGPDDGGHGFYGYFCLAGPGVPAKGQYYGASLLNVAPTVLYYMDIPVPRGMEIKHALSEEEEVVEDLKTEEVFYSEDDEQVIQDRLAALGY